MPRRQGLLGRLSGVAAASVMAAVAFLGCGDDGWIPPIPTNKIFYTTDIDGDQEIYRMDDDGSFQVPIVVSPSSDEAYPAVSPDGQWLAYSSDIDGNLNIYVVASDGSGVPVQVTDNIADENYPAWLSNSVLLYSSDRNGNTDIYSRSSSGTGPETQITTNVADEITPTSIEGGTKVAYARNDGFYHIYSKNSDGSGIATKLTIDSINHLSPKGSPSGDKIALAAQIGGTNWDVCTMSSTGGPLTRLTTDVGIDGNPTWRPDGLELACESNRTGQYKTFTMSSTDGSGQTMVSDPGAHQDFQPAYSPVPTLD